MAQWRSWNPMNVSGSAALACDKPDNLLAAGIAHDRHRIRIYGLLRLNRTERRPGLTIRSPLDARRTQNAAIGTDKRIQYNWVSRHVIRENTPAGPGPGILDRRSTNFCAVCILSIDRD